MMHREVIKYVEVKCMTNKAQGNGGGYGSTLL